MMALRNTLKYAKKRFDEGIPYDVVAEELNRIDDTHEEIQKLHKLINNLRKQLNEEVLSLQKDICALREKCSHQITEEHPSQYETPTVYSCLICGRDVLRIVHEGNVGARNEHDKITSPND